MCVYQAHIGEREKKKRCTSRVVKSATLRHDADGMLDLSKYPKYALVLADPDVFLRIILS